MNMEILDRRKIDTIVLGVGDRLVLTHKDTQSETLLAKTTITATHAMTIDEALLFATEFEGRRALGGMVLETRG